MMCLSISTADVPPDLPLTKRNEANHSAKVEIDGGDIGTSANAEYLPCSANTGKIGTFLLGQYGHIMVD